MLLPDRTGRAVLETMPLVTVSDSPSGAPTATTAWPTVTASDLAKVAAFRFAGGRDLDHGQIGRLGGAHDGGFSRRPVVEGDLDGALLAGPGHHVVVGEDVAVGVQHHAGAESAALPPP